MATQKELFWVGRSKSDVRLFPDDARKMAGYQLRRIQSGLEPTNWKPMATVGEGVREIRINDVGNAYRIFYVLVSAKGVYVLHAFQKTTRKTEQKDIRLGIKRFKEVKREGY